MLYTPRSWPGVTEGLSPPNTFITGHVTGGGHSSKRNRQGCGAGTLPPFHFMPREQEGEPGDSTAGHGSEFEPQPGQPTLGWGLGQVSLYPGRAVWGFESFGVLSWDGTYDLAAAGGVCPRGEGKVWGEESHDSYFPTFADTLSVSHGWERLKPGQVGEPPPLSPLERNRGSD